MMAGSLEAVHTTLTNNVVGFHTLNKKKKYDDTQEIRKLVCHFIFM